MKIPYKKIFIISIIILYISCIIPPTLGIYHYEKNQEKLSNDSKLISQSIQSNYILADWYQQNKLVGSDGNANDQFGSSVSINQDNLIIGVVSDDSNNGMDAGSAYIFNRIGTDWSQKTIIFPSDGSVNDNFGISVSIDGNYAIIGASGDDSNRGSAYVFRWTGIVWSQQAKIIASDREPDDLFGHSVSIKGDFAIIGSFCDDNENGIDAGSAYIFKRSGTTWTQQTKITASDGEDNDHFGISTSIDEKYIIIGAAGENNNTGAAYIFENTGTSWTQQTKITASDGEDNDHFGISTSIDEKYVIVGASSDNNEAGSAYIFRLIDSSWQQEDKLVATDDESGDNFGFSVSIDDITAVVGALNDDNNKGNNAGCTYTFIRRNEPPSSPNINGPTSGKPGIIYYYSLSTIDPEGDQVYYYLDWGDDTNSGWIGLNESGEIINVSHVWQKNGNYDIYVRAKDKYDAVSDWNIFEVVMPKNNALNLIEIAIIQPWEKTLYLWGFPIPILLSRTIIFGNITILVSAASLQLIDKIEFYVNDVLKHVEIDRFEWLLVPWNWDEPILFKHTIKVIAYDNGGFTASDELDVWIFNL